ncbi:hypothetical protein [Fodinibius roseus]|nr:hypothetical protein [Fodinibius roseus]
MKNTNNQSLKEMSNDELLKSFLDELEKIRETEPERYKRNLLKVAKAFEANNNETLGILCRMLITMGGISRSLKQRVQMLKNESNNIES